MDLSEEDFGSLIEFLKERGHSAEEIDKIMAKLRQYEHKVQFDSLMDSIGAGRFNLDEIIQDALEG